MARALTVLGAQEPVEHLLDDDGVEFDQLGKRLDHFVLPAQNKAKKFELRPSPLRGLKLWAGRASARKFKAWKRNNFAPDSFNNIIGSLKMKVGA